MRINVRDQQAPSLIGTIIRSSTLIYNKPTNLNTEHLGAPKMMGFE
jgi:hypothetical protein